MNNPSLDPSATLRSLFATAVESVQPARCVPPILPEPPKGRTVVIGAGKAAAAMAAAVEQNWDGPLEGLVVTRYGHGVPCNAIGVVEAGHPVPDEAGQDAARRILDAVSGLSADDLVLCLLSGGGSALLTLPAPGVPLADKQSVTRALLRSGADIHEINTVRKHLSSIKGGRLALACAPALIHTLAISDVVGDDLAVIASGPTTPDPTTFADAQRILEKYRIDPPNSISRRFAGSDETPKSGDPRLPPMRASIAAKGLDALDAARLAAAALGISARVVDHAAVGEAKAAARQVAARIDGELASGALARPAILLWGGELTVTVSGDGEGGPNGEFLLALAMELNGRPRVHGISCDTDGIDGMGECAGATAGPESLARARALGVDPAEALANNDSYGFFKALGDQIATGPTKTNVNDFRAIFIS